MNTSFAPLATSDTVFFFIGSPWALLGLWLLVINAVTFFLFGLDKWKAKRQARRIRERTLFLLAGLGGSLGAWAGMRVWHHKTLHRAFRFGIPGILLLQTLLPLGLYIYFHFIH